jgi:hypothetical protein
MNQSESKFLERIRIALTNAESHAEIKAALIEYGVDDAKFTQGWELYNLGKYSWELNQQEESETRLVSNSYHTAYGELEMKFKKHRDLCLILCKKDPDTLIQLGVKGRFPTKYNEFFDKVKLFYTIVSTETVVQDKLAFIKLTPEIAATCLAELEEVLALRANFDKEMGESQVATVSKNVALHNLSEWMDEFDTIAKIALYDTPQQLEVLGVLVRS